jgi:hypothetical protein
MERNFQYVYHLNDGRIIVLSSGKYHVGLLLNNKECLDELVKSDYFPIEDKEWETELFKYVDDFKEFIHSDIETKVFEHFKVEIDTSKISLSDIENILKNSTRKQDNRNDDEFKLILYCVGKYIINEYGGNWLLIKWYGVFNPFYRPCVETPHGTYDFYRDLYREYFSRNRFIGRYSDRIIKRLRNESQAYTYNTKISLIDRQGYGQVLIEK